MNICAITCFHGRHRLVERVMRCFIEQEESYGKQYLLLYNNSITEQILADIPLPENKSIILVNNSIDLKTKKEYTNVGDIFRDALTFVPSDTDVVTFMDSDDVFLPTHLNMGWEGMRMAYFNGFLAYKPLASWYLYEDKAKLDNNTLEPSIFVDFKYLQEEGFAPVSISYHQKWLNKLIDEDRILEESLHNKHSATLLYNWEEGHNTWKISGSGDEGINNFLAHREFHKDNGDRILSPVNKEQLDKYYKLVGYETA